VLTKLYHTLAIVALAGLLGLGGFVGYLFASGRLTPERIEKIAGVLRGEQAEEGAGQEITEAPAEEPAEPPRVRSDEEIRKARVSGQLRRASLERVERDVAARQELLDHAMQDLLVQQETLREQQDRWTARKRKERETQLDENFRREVQLVSKMSPKLAKEHVILTWNEHQADAIRLLVALDVSKAQRILEQFKAPDEIEIMHELLEQLRIHQTNELAAGSGRTAGDAAP